MNDLYAVPIKIKHGCGIVPDLLVTHGRFAVDAPAGFEGGGEKPVDSGAGRGGEGDVRGCSFDPEENNGLVSAGDKYDRYLFSLFSLSTWFWFCFSLPR